MCIGVPMRVVEYGEAMALCEGRSGRQRINMLMVGHCPAGSWVMTFLGMAREILTEEDANHINRTLDELEAVLRGDLYLADFAGRD